MGLFFASMLSGVVGAIILNLIDKAIAKQQDRENVCAQIEKGNEIFEKQAKAIAANNEKLKRTKSKVHESIKERHEEAAEIMREATGNIFTEFENDNNQRLADINSTLKQI